MKNINLKDENLKNKKKGASSLSTTISSILILMLLVIYGAIFYLNSSIEKRIIKVESETEELQKSLSQDEYQNAYSFGVKVIDLKNKIGGRDFLPQTQNLMKISENTFEDVAYSNLNSTIKGATSTYTATLIPESEESLVRQINLYKETDGFRGVILNTLSRKEKENEMDNSLVLSADINFELKEEGILDQGETTSGEEEIPEEENF